MQCLTRRTIIDSVLEPVVSANLNAQDLSGSSIMTASAATRSPKHPSNSSACRKNSTTFFDNRKKKKGPPGYLPGVFTTAKNERLVLDETT
jgi:hypothetical protein